MATARAENIDDEIAREWPKQWARANDPTRPGASKRRNNIRRHYREAKAFDVWRAANPKAFCSNCDNCREHHDGRLICDVESTGGCIAPTDPDDVCKWWRKRA